MLREGSFPRKVRSIEARLGSLEVNDRKASDELLDRSLCRFAASIGLAAAVRSPRRRGAIRIWWADVDARTCGQGQGLLAAPVGGG